MADPDAPSPVVPVVLLVLIGSMMAFPSYLHNEPPAPQVSSVKSSATLGAVTVVIPLMLLLVVQVFGLPQAVTVPVANVRNRYSPVIETFTRNASMSIFLFMLILLLLILIPLHSYVHSSWQAHTSPFMMTSGRYYRKSSWF